MDRYCPYIRRLIALAIRVVQQILSKVGYSPNTITQVGLVIKHGKNCALQAKYAMHDCRVVSVRRRRARVQIAAATLSGNSLRQTVHIHCASVHLAAKLVAALLRVAGVTAGLAESNGSLPSGL